MLEDDDEPEYGPQRQDSGSGSDGEEDFEHISEEETVGNLVFKNPMYVDDEHEVRKHVVREILDRIQEASKIAALKVNEAFQSMVGHIRSALKSTIDGTQAFFDNLPGKVKSATSALCNAISEQSSKIWKAIKEGAKDKAKIIRAGFAAVLKKLAATFEVVSHFVGEGKTALLAAAGKVQVRASKFVKTAEKAAGKAVNNLRRKRSPGQSRGI